MPFRRIGWGISFFWILAGIKNEMLFYLLTVFIISNFKNFVNRLHAIK
nr:MAG TPA: hypothetical protein [Caudoviricetes sp.]